MEFRTFGGNYPYMKINNTSLLINQDGSIYHLALKPEQLADTVLIVGDPDRVAEVSVFFDRIDHTVRNREFVTHTGSCRGKKITVMSTGIGTDNIDIVMNELDALVNVDLVNKEPHRELRSLDIIRLGTSGSIQPDIPAGSLALSVFGLGLDNLIHFYSFQETEETLAMSRKLTAHAGWTPDLSRPYFTRGSEDLIRRLSDGTVQGITATAPGFYGPQGRMIRLSPHDPELNDKLRDFNFEGHRIINYEMETSALYSLGKLLGHNTATICALIANRATNEYITDHKPLIRRMVEHVLEKLVS